VKDENKKAFPKMVVSQCFGGVDLYFYLKKELLELLVISKYFVW